MVGLLGGFVRSTSTASAPPTLPTPPTALLQTLVTFETVRSASYIDPVVFSNGTVGAALRFSCDEPACPHQGRGLVIFGPSCDPMFSAQPALSRPCRSQVAQDTKTGSFFRDSTDFSQPGTPSSAIYLRLCSQNVSYYLPKGGKFRKWIRSPFKPRPAVYCSRVAVVQPSNSTPVPINVRLIRSPCADAVVAPRSMREERASPGSVPMQRQDQQTNKQLQPMDRGSGTRDDPRRRDIWRVLKRRRGWGSALQLL